MALVTRDAHQFLRIFILFFQCVKFWIKQDRPLNPLAKCFVYCVCFVCFDWFDNSSRLRFCGTPSWFQFGQYWTFSFWFSCFSGYILSSVSLSLATRDLETIVCYLSNKIAFEFKPPYLASAHVQSCSRAFSGVGSGFDSFPRTFLTLSNLVSGENWDALFDDVSVEYP
jgi:hypothetical protein